MRVGSSSHHIGAGRKAKASAAARRRRQDRGANATSAQDITQMTRGTARRLRPQAELMGATQNSRRRARRDASTGSPRRLCLPLCLVSGHVRSPAPPSLRRARNPSRGRGRNGAPPRRRGQRRPHQHRRLLGHVGGPAPALKRARAPPEVAPRDSPRLQMWGQLRACMKTPSWRIIFSESRDRANSGGIFPGRTCPDSGPSRPNVG